MKYSQFVEKVSNEQNWADVKVCRSVIIKLALFVLGVAVLLGLLVTATLNVSFAILLIILMMFLFLFVIDLVAESKENFEKGKKLANLFFLPYILVVIEFVVLMYFNFI